MNSGYTYDAAGNLTGDGSLTYFYDAENRLIQVCGTGGSCSTVTASYTYDAEGRRVERTTGGVTTYYAYDTAGRVAGEVAGGSWTNGYVYFNGQLRAIYDNIGNTTRFVHQDHLGSTRLLTNMSGCVVDNLDYLPFGELLSNSPACTAADNAHKFTGKERDSESGLDNFGARYYSSAQGRFMSPDPSGIWLAELTDPQQLNLYSYVRNNPLSFTDPNGLQCVWDDGSFDSPDDPDTGSSSGCQNAGGTYFDPNSFQAPNGADWSSDPNSDLANLASLSQQADAGSCPSGVICSNAYAGDNDTSPGFGTLGNAFSSANNGATTKIGPAPPQTKPQLDYCIDPALWSGLKAAAGDFFTPPGADPLGDVGDALRDKSVQRAAVGTLYLVADSARYLTPAAEIAADLIPGLGQVLLAAQIGSSLYQGGKAYKESLNYCHGTH